jgi:integrase/recombinase XerD
MLFRNELERDQFRPGTVQRYLEDVRCFLAYLDRNKKQPEQARPEDVDAFLEAHLKIACRRLGRSPRLPDWRWRYTAPIHRMLRGIQGQWPPASAVDDRLAQLQTHLNELDFDSGYRDLHLHHARWFLKYLDERGLSPESVQPAAVSTYFRVALRLYRKRYPNFVKDGSWWLNIHRRIVHHVLRFVHGEWPPGSAPSPWLARLRTQLEQLRYCTDHIPMRLSAARQFLRYLKERYISPEQADAGDLDEFLQWKLDQRGQRAVALKDIRAWRSRYASPIRQLMRLIQPGWPPPQPPADATERFVSEVHQAYVSWMRDVRGVAEPTIVKNGDEAKRFLRWLGPGASYKTLWSLSVADIDAYLDHRVPELRRATRVGICGSLRTFTAYLRSEGRIDRDLSMAITGPPRYAFAEIPRAFSEEDIQRLLRTVENDRTPSGLRDRAILLLLITYGLRAGEVARLRLDDVDWRAERIRVRQSKTGVESHLPLVTPVGNALLDYLRRARPQTHFREVFLSVNAPYRPFCCGSSLGRLLQRRIKQAGIQPKGRHGTHALRFARAIRLLRASVPIKTIGDLLGHQSADSTGVYLRAAEDDLRAISLEIPQ